MSNSENRTYRILILSSWYPNKIDPFLGNFIQKQAKLLAQEHDVNVIYLKTVPSLTTREIETKQTGRLKEIVVYHPMGKTFFHRKREINQAFNEAIQLIEKPDIIHAHCTLPKGFLFKKAKAHFNCPLIVTEHGSYFRKDRILKWSLPERLIASMVKRSANRILAVSKFQKKDLATYFNKHRIEVIPNPVDTSFFRPLKTIDEEPIKFLHVSTLDPVLKNPNGIIEAVDLLCAKGYRNFHFTFISDEPFDHLIQKVAVLKLDGFVSFEGPLNPEQLVERYNSHHALVMFSRYETFSIVIAEAWSCGLPVISTPVGIAAEMTNEQGLIIEHYDSLSLALEMEKLLNGKSFHRQIIRDRALKYDDQVVLKQLTTLYHDVTG